MKFLRDSLEETRKHMGVQRDAVECDYALSWILAGVRRIPSLKDTLVFRGGGIQEMLFRRLPLFGEPEFLSNRGRYSFGFHGTRHTGSVRCGRTVA